MIHPQLGHGASQLAAAAADADPAEVARIALPVIASGLHLAYLDMVMFLLDLELEQL